MNIQKMFETQAKLDDRIVKEKGLQGQDLLDKKILALQVELGELAQEWRGFKFWSNDQEPRTEVYWGPPELPDVGTYTNPLLEEYVDCLHFILSIGNEIGASKHEYVELMDLTNNITAQFISVFQLIGNLREEYLYYMDKSGFNTVVNEFLCLGKTLGFTWEQIESEYYHKNKINHERQDNGY